MCSWGRGEVILGAAARSVLRERGDSCPYGREECVRRWEDGWEGGDRDSDAPGFISDRESGEASSGVLGSRFFRDVLVGGWVSRVASGGELHERGDSHSYGRRKGG